LKTLTGSVLFKSWLGSPCITRWKALLLVTLMLLLQSCSDSPVHLNGVIEHKGDVAHPGKRWQLRIFLSRAN
jgi:hypothetical protein